MGDMTLIASVIGAVVSVIVAIITGIFSYKQTKLKSEIEVNSKRIDENSKRSEMMQKNRSEENLLAMKLTAANTQLTVGCAMAIKNGHANGEMEAGLKAVNDASAEYRAFLARMANDHLHE